MIIKTDEKVYVENMKKGGAVKNMEWERIITQTESEADIEKGGADACYVLNNKLQTLGLKLTVSNVVALRVITTSEWSRSELL